MDCKKLLLKTSALFLCIFLLLLVIKDNTVTAANSMLIGVYIDDVQVVFHDVEPYIDANARTLVPVRFPTEALGATVLWNQANEQVTIIKGDNTVILTSNSADYQVNGEWRQMDTVMVYNRQAGRNFVPLRFVLEGLGLTVAWEQTNNVGKILVTTVEKKVDKTLLVGKAEKSIITEDKIRIFIDSGHGVNHTQDEYYLFPPGMEQFFKENNLRYTRPTHYNFSAGAPGEMQINWAVSSFIYQLLINDGRFEVLRDRQQFEDLALANQERMQKANQWKSDLILSIHAEKTRSIGGYFAVMPGKDYVFPDYLGGYYNQAVRAGSEEFAKHWLAALDIAELGWGRWRDGYYRSDSGYILHRWAQAPIVIIEMDSNTTWSNSIEVRENQQKFANATYLAILNYFELRALHEGHQITLQELDLLVPEIDFPEIDLEVYEYERDFKIKTEG